eukprot:COSAG05_NODE_461_length_9571_cov_14.935283_2_plen_116_part_00
MEWWRHRKRKAKTCRFGERDVKHDEEKSFEVRKINSRLIMVTLTILTAAEELCEVAHEAAAPRGSVLGRPYRHQLALLFCACGRAHPRSVALDNNEGPHICSRRWGSIMERTCRM